MDGTEGRKALDEVDVQILQALQAEGRTAWARLAEIVGMSAPAVTERVKRLEEGGYIKGFHAELDAGALGLGTLGFVAVAVRDTAEHVRLLEQVRKVDEIQECHVIVGEYDYLLRVRCAGPEAMAALLRERVRNLPGVVRTNTLLVLETIKETTSLPVRPMGDVDRDG